ncbi:hypothetical protein BDC45DRAFT_93113 [Circinella umbellata]|nr:hypothetical protein BDC45DRAFT_93113 [Circinella umbellata]
MEINDLVFEETGQARLQHGELVFEEEKPHLQGELQRRKTLPSFVKKLWFIINDSSTDNLACWTSNGQGLYVPDAAAFAKSVLPQYFKHNNWQSFVRQLNLYGFRKVCDSEVPANPNQCEQQQSTQQQSQQQQQQQEGWQFRHDCFRRDSSHLLHHIVRKRGHCRQPLSDSSMADVGGPVSGGASGSSILNTFSSGNSEATEEIPQRLAKIEHSMQQMEAKSATAQNYILQLRLAQTRQNETISALLGLAKYTLTEGKKFIKMHMEINQYSGFFRFY